MEIIVRTHPVEDPHMEQVNQDQIINLRLVHLSKPLCSLDHVGPESIIKEEVQEHVPLPLILINCQISGTNHTKETVLGYLTLLSISSQLKDYQNRKQTS